MKFLLLITLFLSLHCKSQDTLAGCPMNGDRHIVADILKNRWVFPPYYNKMDLSYLMKLKNNEIKSTDPVEITGYIMQVKDGGLESTNCHSSKYKDTHIYVVENPSEKNKANALIVEVTPRIREIMKKKGIDWNTKALQLYLGKHVIIDGYLFCDSEHKQNSKADSPNGKHLWRSTVYEVHPVTGIKIIK